MLGVACFTKRNFTSCSGFPHPRDHHPLLALFMAEIKSAHFGDLEVIWGRVYTHHPRPPGRLRHAPTPTAWPLYLRGPRPIVHSGADPLPMDSRMLNPRCALGHVVHVKKSIALGPFCGPPAPPRKKINFAPPPAFPGKNTARTGLKQWPHKATPNTRAAVNVGPAAACLGCVGQQAGHDCLLAPNPV